MESSLFSSMGNALSFLLFFFTAVAGGLAPTEFLEWLSALRHKIFAYLSPYLRYEVHESVGGVESNLMYNDVKAHLGSLASAKAKDADIRCLSLTKGKDKKMSFDLSDQSVLEEIFQGAKFSWVHIRAEKKQMGMHWDAVSDEKWWYVLKVHKRDAKLLDSYISHISSHSLTLQHMNTERKIYTNIMDDSWEYRKKPWQHATFRHPSTFDTMALDPQLKQSIIKDLDAFIEGKDFYTRTGRAWKRGYLLHGPPGTGKSSLVGAIANYTGYDIYDLELTEIKSNNQLKKLFMRTTNKSIMLIEDIDCTIKLENRVDPKQDTEEKKKEKEEENTKEKPRVTLSGMLNFIDGIWSACGEERLIVFTTNHPEKLDPALIRAGRMDMHILLSYCRFPAFKVLASRYLGIEQHDMFDEIDSLLEVADMTPADVAETLCRHREDVDMALSSLVIALKKTKEDMELLKLKQDQDQGVHKAYEDLQGVQDQDQGVHKTSEVLGSSEEEPKEFVK